MHKYRIKEDGGKVMFDGFCERVVRLCLSEWGGLTQISSKELKIAHCANGCCVLKSS